MAAERLPKVLPLPQEASCSGEEGAVAGPQAARLNPSLPGSPAWPGAQVPGDSAGPGPEVGLQSLGIPGFGSAARAEVPVGRSGAAGLGPAAGSFRITEETAVPAPAPEPPGSL